MRRRVFDLETGELAGEVEIDEVSGLTRFASGRDDLKETVKSCLWRGPIKERSEIVRVNGEVVCCAYDTTISPQNSGYLFALLEQYKVCGAKLELLEGDFDPRDPVAFGPMPPPEYGFNPPEEAWFQRWKPGWHSDEDKRRF